jgi:hypothetical protein
MRGNRELHLPREIQPRLLEDTPQREQRSPRRQLIVRSYWSAVAMTADSPGPPARRHHLALAPPLTSIPAPDLDPVIPHRERSARTTQRTAQHQPTANLTVLQGGTIMTPSAHRSRPNELGPATVNPRDEPSARWGWHGGFPRGSVIAGGSTAAIPLSMVITRLVSGHSEGHIPDVYLDVISTALILLLIRHTARARHSWRQ